MSMAVEAKDWRRANCFGHIAGVVHWTEREDGTLVESTKATCWATWNEFHPAAFEAYPQIVRRDGDEIVVTAVNGTARYRVDASVAPADEWIPAVLIDVQIRPHDCVRLCGERAAVQR